jgi:hypothetical protein
MYVQIWLVVILSYLCAPGDPVRVFVLKQKAPA